MQYNDLIRFIEEQKKTLLLSQAFIKNKNLPWFEKIKENKIVTITGWKYSWKQEYIKQYIQQNNISFFYFNNSLDVSGNITDIETLTSTLNLYLETYPWTNTIILENIFNIPNIQILIKHVYAKDVKTILIWNNISIANIPQIDIFDFPMLQNIQELEEITQYGSLQIVKEIQNIPQKKQLLEHIKSATLLSEIIIPYAVKNIFLYTLLLWEISKINSFISQRDILAHIEPIHHTSLKTIIDYIDFSLQSQVIKKIYRYDFKKQTQIKAKAKYYFIDTGLRNNLSHYTIDTSLLQENLVYLKLLSQNYSLYSWKNGIFEATFYWEKADINILLHIFTGSSSDQIKSDIRKIIKIWLQKSSQKSLNQILLVNNLAEYHLRKYEYEGIKIIDFDEWFLGN